MKKVEMLSKELIKVRQELKELKDKEAILKNELTPLLPNDEKIIVNFNDDLFYVEKKDIEKNQFNLNLFKSNHPKLYQKYLELQTITTIFSKKLPLKEQLKISNIKKARV